MKLELRMNYLETIYQRYRKASKESKGRILDELCKICKYKRKYAIWKLSQMPMEDKHNSRRKRRSMKLILSQSQNFKNRISRQELS